MTEHSGDTPLGPLAGAFPELASLTDADLEWAKQQWQRGVDRQLELMGYAPFDAVDYLDDEETIAEYLAAAREDPNPEVLQAAEQDVLRARLRARDAAPPGASETMLATEAVLRRDRERPEEESAWTDL